MARGVKLADHIGRHILQRNRSIEPLGALFLSSSNAGLARDDILIYGFRYLIFDIWDIKC